MDGERKNFINAIGCTYDEAANQCWRKNKIERIMCDKSEKNLIFIVEKMIEDDTGISIRYMIEATKF